jgi:hypothetical protein
MLFCPAAPAGENPDFSTWIALSAGAMSAGFAVWHPMIAASRSTATPAPREMHFFI